MKRELGCIRSKGIVWLFAFLAFVPMTIFAADGGPTITAEQIEYNRSVLKDDLGKLFVGLTDEMVKPANYVNNFDALKTFVTNYAKTKNVTSQYRIDVLIAWSAIAVYGKNPAVNSLEAYAFMKSIKNQNFAYNYLNSNYGNFSNAQLFDEYATALQKADDSQANKVQFNRAIAKFIVLCPQVDSVKAKTALQTLNRIYSPYLLKNKTVWEPIVAQIRVALETY